MSDEQLEPPLSGAGPRNLVDSSNNGSGNDPLPVDPAVLKKIADELAQSGVKKDRAPSLAISVVREVQTLHSGPLPPVSDFDGYEQICPGAARDILEMAKSDLAHQHEMDKLRASGEIGLKLVAMVIAGLIVFIIVGGAIYAAVAGHENVAIVIATGTGVAAVIGVLAKILLTAPKETPKPKPPTPKRGKRK
jgi:uncharacterized membrane protein